MIGSAKDTAASDRLGFVSATGALVAAIVLAGVLGFTLLEGPLLFSPGPLNAQAKTRTLGGVTSHAQLAADCGACHTAPWSPQTMADRCLACHKDISDQVSARSGLHGGLLGALPSPTCRGCHPEHNGPDGTLTAFDGGAFPHELTGYSLRGHRRTTQGAKVACTDCHTRDLAHFDPASCAACHGALDAGFMRSHEAAFGGVCLPCHDGADRYGANFDHNSLPFKLTGKHADVACDRCHSGASSVQALQQTAQDCYSCHAKNDEHRGAFGQQCGQCHTTRTWANANFNHAVFPVNHGARGRSTPCDTCHPTGLNSYYCLGCHEHTAANVRSEHEGRPASQLADCIRCHAGGRGGD